jgi:hypothetical protein
MPQKPKAHVAFDLDNTLGFFEVTNPLAWLWSPDTLENPVMAHANASLRLSPQLQRLLKKTRTTFANLLLKRPDLLWFVLRPNLRAMFEPLLSAYKKGNVAAVIIYSNTGNAYSVELGKYLIEKLFKSPHLFSLTADAFHPLRTADRPHAHPPHVYVEPNKTYNGLEDLLQAATGKSTPIHPDHVAFVDDRTVPHKLLADVPRGLTYIRPTPYFPRATQRVKQELFNLAMEAIDATGLLANEEYAKSGFCHRSVPFSFVHKKTLRGFPDLVVNVWKEMERVHGARAPWQNDAMSLESEMTGFLEKF